RLDPLLERISLIGKSQFGAMRVRGLRDAPGDRAAVRYPHDEAALAAHQTGRVRHAATSMPPAPGGGFLWHRAFWPASNGRARIPRLRVRARQARRRRIGEYRAKQRCFSKARRGIGSVPARGRQVSGFRQGIQATIPALRRYARALTRDAEAAEDLV